MIEDTNIDLPSKQHTEWLQGLCWLWGEVSGKVVTGWFLWKKIAWIADIVSICCWLTWRSPLDVKNNSACWLEQCQTALWWVLILAEQNTVHTDQLDSSPDMSFSKLTNKTALKPLSIRKNISFHRFYMIWIRKPFYLFYSLFCRPFRKRGRST